MEPIYYSQIHNPHTHIHSPHTHHMYTVDCEWRPLHITHVHVIQVGVVTHVYIRYHNYDTQLSHSETNQIVIYLAPTPHVM